MGNPFSYFRDGSVCKDNELSKIGLWFFLTYAYFKITKVDSEKRLAEKSFKQRKNYNYWVSYIKKYGDSNNNVYYWIKYGHERLKKRTTNKGNVTLEQQKEYARALMDACKKDKRKTTNIIIS